jgi:hypothetical protein
MNKDSFKENLFKIYNNINNETLELPNRNFLYYLMKYDFDIPFATDNNKNTLLQCMIKQSDHIGINLLLSKKLNKKYLNNQNIEGSTAFHIAIQNDMQDIAKRLDILGADKNLMDKNGYQIEYINDKNELESSSSIYEFLNFIKQFSETNDNIENIDNYIISENLDESNKPNFINFLNKLGDLHGGKNSIKGSRSLKKDNKVNSTSDSLGIKSILEKELKISSSEQRGGNTFRRKSSRQKKLSSELHDNVIEMIKKVGYSKEDAIYIKAGLYNKVKTQYPELSNLKKAEKLKEIATQSEINNMGSNLDELKRIVDDARSKKINLTSSQSENKKEIKNPKKLSDSKPVKKEKVKKEKVKKEKVKKEKVKKEKVKKAKRSSSS